MGGIKLMVVDPKDHPNLPVFSHKIPDKTAPAFMGDGSGYMNYLCGACGQAVAKGLQFGQIRNIVVQCGCGAFNAFPG